MQETTPLKYCSNCATELVGNYCHNCGQKKYSMNHFTVKFFFSNFFDSLFNWDSKILRTMKALLFKPGLLTNEYISGRFEPYVMPLKLYVFLAFVIFLINSKIDTAGILTQNFEDNGIYGGFTRIIMDSKNVSYETIRDKVNSGIYNYFSFYVIITIFFFAFPLKLIYLTSKRYFVEHLVFSTHFFIFILITFTLFTFYQQWEDWGFIISMTLQFIYLFVALKKVYNEKVMVCFFESVLMFIIYFMCLFFLFIFAIVVTALLV